MALRSFSTPAAVGTAVRPLHPKTTASLSLLATRTGLALKPLMPLILCLFSLRLSTNSILWRASIFRCATIEEIEAEKYLIEKDARERMEKTIEAVRSNFNAVRTGRANPAMLDGIEVEYYGSPVTLKSIAQITTPDASSLLVQPFDKSSLKVIEKAIVSSDLGLTPNNDGEAIRLGIPQLTSERRKEFLKLVAKQAEEGKIQLMTTKKMDALEGEMEQLKAGAEEKYSGVEGRLSAIENRFGNFEEIMKKMLEMQSKASSAIPRVESR
ncbi:hypothetical protein M5K25_003060 [Dendrobium thyrsiflorum]|uniref:Ribosome-recycling factor, chloroplastic n=1 Tax=Dendrobium thyrsiflorum TaxID=117978 RepID=A0ABD0VPC2_DENTH